MTSPIPVAMHGWSVSAYLLAGLNVLFGGGALGAFGIWLKTRPNMQDAVSKDRASDFTRLREDIAAIKADAKEARDEARRVSDIAQRLENMVACMRPAISILSAEVKRLDPGNATNAALLQVQELMTMAAAGDLGINKAMIGLAATRGTGE